MSNENSAKGAIIGTAVISMGMSITFCALWGTYLQVTSDPAFDCQVEGVVVTDTWSTAIKLNFWTYLIISISGLLAVAGAFVPAIRLANSVIQSCCLGTLQLAAIIYLGVVRLNRYGAVCADPGIATQFPLVNQTSTFMLNMFISQCVLSCCIMSCMSTSAKFK